MGKPVGRLAPVETAGVDYHTTNGRAVPTQLLGCGVDNNINAMLDNGAPVSTGTEGVVNLGKRK